VLGLVVFLARCDRTDQLAPSMDRVVGLRADGARLTIVTGAPCPEADRIVMVFRRGPRAQLVAQPPLTSTS
jgi:hypothetical protein